MVPTPLVAQAAEVDPRPVMLRTVPMAPAKAVEMRLRVAEMVAMAVMVSSQVARMVQRLVVVVVVPNEDVALQHPEAMERMVASS